MALDQKILSRRDNGMLFYLGRSCHREREITTAPIEYSPA